MVHLCGYQWYAEDVGHVYVKVMDFADMLWVLWVLWVLWLNTNWLLIYCLL
jgi:hypothetical protein